jgi:predicted TPR repeat methyltransferase
MLARARARGVYAELAKAELSAFLAARREAYDVLVAADTLCYFGALEELAAAAWGALRPGGLLVATLEDAGSRPAPRGYRIDPHGRYSHACGYARAVLAAAGFARLGDSRGVLRTEGGVAVDGIVIRARKPGETVAASPPPMPG